MIACAAISCGQRYGPPSRASTSFCAIAFAASGELTFDHVIPRADGGQTCWTSIVSACGPCNGRKDRSRARPLRAPFEPTQYDLRAARRLFPPNFMHETWVDFLCRDSELEQEPPGGVTAAGARWRTFPARPGNASGFVCWLGSGPLSFIDHVASGMRDLDLAQVGLSRPAKDAREEERLSSTVHLNTIISWPGPTWQTLGKFPATPGSEEIFMRVVFRLLRSGGLVVAISMAACGVVLAQASPPPQAAAKQGTPTQATPKEQAAPNDTAAESPEVKQIALTEKQIEGVISAQKEVDGITDKLEDNAEPDAKMIAALDAAVKKYGFASYDEYSDVVDNINLVLGGVDAVTRKYVGPEAVIKAQIAAVEGDTKLPAKDKKAALDELNQVLKVPPPAITNGANIDLVMKYYDKLISTFDDEQD